MPHLDIRTFAQHPSSHLSLSLSLSLFLSLHPHSCTSRSCHKLTPTVTVVACEKFLKGREGGGGILVARRTGMQVQKWVGVNLKGETLYFTAVAFMLRAISISWGIFIFALLCETISG